MSGFVSASYTRNQLDSESSITINNVVHPYTESPTPGNQRSSSEAADKPVYGVVYPTASHANLSTDDNQPIIKSREVSTPIDAFKTLLLEILIGLFSQDINLINNVIEPTGDVILSVYDLKSLIKILTGSSKVDIIQEPLSSDCSCLWNSLPLYKFISKIKVDGNDFHITHNNEYNILANHKICLTKVI